MSESREFLELIFSDEFVQRLEIDVMQPTSDERDVLIIYSDCSEEDEGALHGRRTQRQAIFAYDQRDGSHHSAHCEVSAEYIEQHFSERKTYIGVGEEAAAVAALYSLPPAMLRGRRVIHFVDNAGSLSHLVNGYASKPDSARIVNMFHAALIAFDIEWWGEWVPSKANIADIMTRPERFAELLAGLRGAELTEHELKLPPLGDDWTSLRAWMRTMRDRAQSA